MARVALILSGCGVFDGAEIHESTLCLLALAQAGHRAACFAPDIPQRDVINHLTSEPMEEQRNVLVESARIARGKISPLSELKVDEFDAILLPGGFGAAKNLCDYAINGEQCTVLPELADILRAFHKAGKVIGATCITPALLAKVFENEMQVTLTLGSLPENKESLEKMGAKGVLCNAHSVVDDDKNRIYTTPCYMEDTTLAELFVGITDLVSRF